MLLLMKFSVAPQATSWVAMWLGDNNNDDTNPEQRWFYLIWNYPTAILYCILRLLTINNQHEWWTYVLTLCEQSCSFSPFSSEADYAFIPSGQAETSDRMLVSLHRYVNSIWFSSSLQSTLMPPNFIAHCAINQKGGIHHICHGANWNRFSLRVGREQVG